MESTNRLLLILWIAAAVCPAQTTTILAYDYAGMPAGKWTQAAAGAGRLLAKAGYPVDWIACRGADVRPEAAARCKGELVADTYVLRIMSGKGLRARGNKQVLAYALVDHSNSAYATVFLEPIQEHADYLGVPPNKVLACAVAHEIVHLLRGPAHSPWGLMKAVWDRHDATAIAQLDLPLR